MVAIVITPDSIRDGLEKQIIDDILAAAPIRILWRKYWAIPNKETVLVIYPRLAEKPSYTSVIKTMMMGECLVLLIQGEDAFIKLKEAKGKIKYTPNGVEISGIRKKYKNWTYDEIKNLGYESQTAMDKIFEYRLHSADNIIETATLCALCMDENEIKFLEKIDTCAYNEIMRIKIAMKAARIM